MFAVECEECGAALRPPAQGGITIRKPARPRLARVERGEAGVHDLREVDDRDLVVSASTSRL